MERQVLNRFYSKQRRLLRSAVKFSITNSSSAPCTRRHRHHPAWPIPYAYAQSYHQGRDSHFSRENTKPRNPIKQCCLRERKLTFLFIPFILHCQTSKSNESGTVTVKEAWELAKFLGTSYVENSATTGENVKDVVYTALRVVADQRKLQRSKCRCHRLFKWINKCKHRK